jgi:hypothetical protein
VYDAELGVGACGDWLADPSVAGAWTSGLRLADHLLSSRRPASRGLGRGGRGGGFAASEAAARSGIGSLGPGPSPSALPQPAPAAEAEAAPLAAS